MNQEVLKIRKELDRMKKRYDKLREDIRIKRDTIQSICTHEDVNVEERYVEGGYLDRAEYIKKFTCKICGKDLGEKITYGGFN